MQCIELHKAQWFSVIGGNVSLIGSSFSSGETLHDIQPILVKQLGKLWHFSYIKDFLNKHIGKKICMPVVQYYVKV